MYESKEGPAYLSPLLQKARQCKTKLQSYLLIFPLALS